MTLVILASKENKPLKLDGIGRELLMLQNGGSKLEGVAVVGITSHSAFYLEAMQTKNKKEMTLLKSDIEDGVVVLIYTEIILSEVILKPNSFTGFILVDLIHNCVKKNRSNQLQLIFLPYYELNQHRLKNRTD